MKNTIVFALSSSVGLAEDICKELGLELGKCEVKHFADGEILVELGESVRGKHVYFVQSTNKPVNSNLMEILIGIDACKRASALQALRLSFHILDMLVRIVKRNLVNQSLLN